jgi:hypothetical protein
MKKLILVLAVLALTVGLANTAMAQAKPPKSICLTFTDAGGSSVQMVVTTKAAGPNVNMATRRYKAYSVTGEYNHIYGAIVLSAPFSGSGHVYTDAAGDSIFHFSLAGAELFFGPMEMNGSVLWNLTNSTGTAAIVVAGTSYIGALSVINCAGFDFSY